MAEQPPISRAQWMLAHTRDVFSQEHRVWAEVPSAMPKALPLVAVDARYLDALEVVAEAAQRCCDGEAADGRYVGPWARELKRALLTVLAALPAPAPPDA